jgi:hypothetical protein
VICYLSDLVISALGAQVFAHSPHGFSFYFGFASGAFRDSPNATLALVSLYTVVFLLLLATVLFEGDGFVSRSDHHIWPPRNPVKELSAALRFFVSTFSVSLVQGR